MCTVQHEIMMRRRVVAAGKLAGGHLWPCPSSVAVVAGRGAWARPAAARRGSIGNLRGPRLGPGPAFATGSEAPSALRLDASRGRGMARADWAGIALPSKRPQGAKHTLSATRRRRAFRPAQAVACMIRLGPIRGSIALSGNGPPGPLHLPQRGPPTIAGPGRFGLVGRTQ